MKTRIILAAAIALLLTAPVFAQVAVPPPPCQTQSLADYILLGSTGCVYDNVLYNDFSYATPGLTGLTAAQITVTPVPLPIAVGVPISELTFSANWVVAAGQAEQSSIGYEVAPYISVANPVATSATLTLELGPSQVSGIIGNVIVKEQVTAPTSVTGTTLEVFDTCADACALKQTDTVTITSVSSLQTTINVALSGGTGGATLSSFSVLDDF
jgi:hypothetical protein